MSGDNKKLIWISAAVCGFILVLAVAGLFLFAPQKGGASAPATLGNVAAPKAVDPQDFLQAPPPAPSLEAPRTEGDIIVIYGDKPTEIQGGGVSVATPSGTGAAGDLTGAAAPTAPQPAAVSPKPATAAAKPAAATAKAPAAAKTATAKTAAPAPKKPVEEFWIQAASFTSRGRADELKDSLGGKGLAALITVKDISGKSWYRVRVGPYSTKKEAEGWLGRVKAVPGCEEAGVWTSTAEKR